MTLAQRAAMAGQTWQLLVGDALTQIARLPEASVQCVVTSPPYWGLRDYGVDGQIGLEPTPERYVQALIDLFRQVWRVLRDDGTVWINLGDAYANDDKWGGSSGGKHVKALHGQTGIGRNRRETGLKPKDLIGLPWMVAFALRADGWFLRSDIIWRKPNCMPESVQDRPTRSHEYVFLLSKSKSYAYDADAIRSKYAESTLQQFVDGYDGEATKDYEAAGVQNASDLKSRIIANAKNRQAHPQSAGRRIVENVAAARAAGGEHDNPFGGGANARSVWDINPEPSSLPHFAMMPKALARKCILAGCPASLGPEAMVLDPFAGAGTTGVVALEEGRSFVGVELNPKYAEIARERLAATSPLFAEERAFQRTETT